MPDAMSPQDVAALGLQPPTREFLDFKKVTMTKEPRKAVDGIARGEYITEEAAKRLPPQPEVAALPVVPASSEAPLTPLAPAATNPALPALPAVQPPGALPTERDFIESRMSKIFGQNSADDRIAQLEARLSGAIDRLEGRIVGQAREAAYQPSMPAHDQPPDGFVSRTELQRILEEQGRQLGQTAVLGQNHVIARMEAERDFPDVYQSPAVKEVVDRIWASDPLLRQDPKGPYKAAMMARGLAVRGGSLPAGGGASATEQKAMLSGFGPTVPQGTAPPEDQVTRYARAKARYEQTGKPEDYVHARRIALGTE